jgi:enoyl-CoA hydratase
MNKPVQPPLKPDGDEDLSNSVLYEVVEDHICKITLNRPHRKNAILTPTMR